MADVQITPEPTETEAAAIAAAAMVVLAPPAADGPHQPEVPRWRFSGRWWSAPVSLRRARP